MAGTMAGTARRPCMTADLVVDVRSDRAAGADAATELENFDRSSNVLAPACGWTGHGRVMDGNGVRGTGSVNSETKAARRVQDPLPMACVGMSAGAGVGTEQGGCIRVGASVWVGVERVVCVVCVV